jgi:DNA mismatch endonuclease (patch repair protein)
VTASPSFKGLSASSAAASRTKARNRSSDTGPELLLRKALTKLGLRYRLHAPNLAGKPDIVFSSRRVLVFCDGDFWHGRHWRARKLRLSKGANAAYWTTKIRSNMIRDRKHARALEREGWTVIRVWETDVKRDAAKIAQSIARVLARKRTESRGVRRCGLMRA